MTRALRVSQLMKVIFHSERTVPEISMLASEATFVVFKLLNFEVSGTRFKVNEHLSKPD